MMTTYSMKIPPEQARKTHPQPAVRLGQQEPRGTRLPPPDPRRSTYVANLFRAQCDALNATNSQISDDDASEGAGTWTYVSSTRSCDKQRKLSWLEKTMWTMYEQQSGDTIDWLSTSRNTLVASSGTVSTLQNSVLPMYDAWDTNVNKYLNIAQGVLIVAAAISLMVLAALSSGRSAATPPAWTDTCWARSDGSSWAVFMGSVRREHRLTFFKQAHMTKTVVNGVPTAGRTLLRPSRHGRPDQEPRSSCPTG